MESKKIWTHTPSIKKIDKPPNTLYPVESAFFGGKKIRTKSRQKID
ncbi:hypothetical protein RCH33_2787 [Flavobacterium daejeonense]|nr:hypothetical protein RCH33_2787 [Flavobacterium daejeonense]